MINDSDGTNYPFYGNRSEMALVTGPESDESVHQVSMSDNFAPQITWEAPISNYSNFYSNKKHKIAQPGKLTHVLRDQSFVTWLAALNINTWELSVLRTYEWRMRVEIDVDMSRMPNERAWLVDDGWYWKLRCCRKDFRIPTCVLYPPNANSAQELVWYPNEARTSQKPTRVISSQIVSVKKLF